MVNWKRILSRLRNKYIITALVFLVWMMFFDRNDFISQYTYRTQLHKLENDKAYYLDEIKQNREDMLELMSDPAHLEKFARERYLMKKDHEDIYLIVYKGNKKEKKYEE